MSKPLKEQILEEISILPQGQQRRILDFARTLTRPSSGGVAGKELLRFAGAIDADELHMMTLAIEHDCERIDLNEW